MTKDDLVVKSKSKSNKDVKTKEVKFKSKEVKEAKAEIKENAKTEERKKRPLPEQQPQQEEKILKKKQKKALREERKALKPGFEVQSEMRRICQTVHRKNVGTDEKASFVEQAVQLIEQHPAELASKHDTSRDIQAVIRYANAGQIERMGVAFQSCFWELVEGSAKYSVHVLGRLMRATQSSRPRELFSLLLKGKMLRLLKLNDASGLVDDLYRRLSCTERSAFVSELYGPEFLLFSTKESLAQIVAAKPAKKDLIAANLKTVLLALKDKKRAMNFALVHRLLDEWLSLLSPKEAASEVAEWMEQVDALAATAEGCRAIARLVAAGSAKERKQLLKALKPHYASLLRSGDSVIALLALAEYTDDTVLLGKGLLEEGNLLLKETILSAALSSEMRGARRLLLLLLAGRRGEYITPETVAFLAACDPLASLSSRKDPAIRRKELQAVLLPAVLAAIREEPTKFFSQFAAAFVPLETLILLDDLSILSDIVPDLKHFLEASKVHGAFLKMLCKKSPLAALVIWKMARPIVEQIVSIDSTFRLSSLLHHPEVLSLAKADSSLKTVLSSVPAAKDLSELLKN